MRRTKEEAEKTRETILKAAAQIIIRSGVGGFTIDAVAHEAALTKGGVLHHFPSKDALVDGLIAQVSDGFNARLDTELESEPAGQPGRWLRAYIRSIFSVQYEDINLIPALAAAVIANPQTMERLRARIAASQTAALQDGLDPTMATVIRLAVDGFLFTRAFSLNVLDHTANQQVYDELLRLTYVVG